MEENGAVAAGDGGVRFCQNIPPGWSEKRFKYLAQTVKGHIPPSTKGDSPDAKTAPYLSMEYLRGEIERPVFVKADHDSLYAENGDVLLLWDGANAGEFCIAKAGIVSSTMAKIMPIGVDDRFLFWMCKGREDFVRSETVGMGIPHVNGHSLANMRVPLPPLPRQRAIADYLDRETGRLDALVAAKRRLLELLAEKRRALIAHAVTRGLDAEAPTKPTGIEWMQEVPAHWGFGRLKDFGRLISGSGFPHEFQGKGGQPLPFYKVGDLSYSKDNCRMAEAQNTVSHATASKLGAYVVPEGAIIYAKIGAAIFLNRRRMTTIPCCIDNNMTAYVSHKELITPGWAFYWISILDFGALANPGAVPSLSEGYQTQLPFAVPLLDEQIAICDHLDRETGRLDALAGRTRESVALLRERRAALISSAVGGQWPVAGGQ